MKKLLALVLALVMTMSLVTISNAAFKDADSIDNKEAVEVMNAVGVLIGDEKGNFNAKDTLTRAQAAKIICVMLLGKTAADGLNLNANFTDVSGWAESYIAYCASQGIVAGVGDGKFDPNGQLTGYQFAKMLLVALGYDASLESMTGADWQVNTAKLALSAGLNKDLDISLSKVITRDEAAQLAFNTLKATMVAYTNGTKVETTDGTKVTVNSTRYNVANDAANSDQYDNSTNRTMQFCEQYFGKLKVMGAASGDTFGRPAHKWAYKGVTIGTYGETADKTYTAAASGSTTAAKIDNMGIKGYTIAGTGVTPVVNGKTTGVSAVTALSEIVALTGNGTVVELFFNDNNIEEITNIVVIKTQLMQVNRINNAAKTVTLKKVDSAGETIAAVDDENDCYAALSAMKADDYVLVTYAWNSTDGAYEVKSIAEPTAVTGKLTRVSTNDSSAVNGVTVAGTAYSLAATKGTAFASLNNSSLNSSKDCTVYIDSYGYAVYIKDVTATAQYIIYADKYSSLVDGKIITQVTGYDMDGVKITLNVGTAAVTASAGNVYSYTTTTANDADYAIGAEVALKGTSAITKSAIKYGVYYLADDVDFLFVSKDAAGKVDSVTVKSGKQAVNSGTPTYAILNSDGKVETIVVLGEADISTGSSVAYVKKLAGYAGKVDGKETYLYDLYIDGALVKGVQSKNSVTVGGFVTYEQNGELYALKDYTVNSGKATSVKTGITLSASNIVSGKYLSLDNSTVDYTMAKDGVVIDLTADCLYGDLGDMGDATGKTFTVSVVFNDNSASDDYKTVSYIFIKSVS